ncbi:21371_t:CDS:2 [Cetraspora pellucida]|uniref:21371_t:CDS:1 n=1 Tax=Cetraspora pellucida TaxID=1433469 RepID=A0A9N9BUX7_9GLOM|nr:21371_t:CDS:2 [Cetraspora pellucida]
MAHHSDETIIWEGTVWPLGCLSPLCCSSVHWKITNKRIDSISGCCGSSEHTVDVRRIIDLEFHRSCLQMLSGRGTLTVHIADSPPMCITTFGMRSAYTKLKEAWLTTKNVVNVV